mmetsp:Transcript_13038/g.19290  ORF Transcript_13038/g.19290 Transcript_13038/m.19290 type:complete len:348 (+) Transcript_13038:3765-4808(+)
MRLRHKAEGILNNLAEHLTALKSSEGRLSTHAKRSYLQDFRERIVPTQEPDLVQMIKNLLLDEIKRPPIELQPLSLIQDVHNKSKSSISTQEEKNTFMMSSEMENSEELMPKKQSHQDESEQASGGPEGGQRENYMINEPAAKSSFLTLLDCGSSDSGSGSGSGATNGFNSDVSNEKEMKVSPKEDNHVGIDRDEADTIRQEYKNREDSSEYSSGDNNKNKVDARKHQIVVEIDSSSMSSSLCSASDSSSCLSIQPSLSSKSTSTSSNDCRDHDTNDDEVSIQTRNTSASGISNSSQGTSSDNDSDSDSNSQNSSDDDSNCGSSSNNSKNCSGNLNNGENSNMNDID